MKKIIILLAVMLLAAADAATGCKFTTTASASSILTTQSKGDAYKDVEDAWKDLYGAMLRFKRAVKSNNVNDLEMLNFQLSLCEAKFYWVCSIYDDKAIPKSQWIANANSHLNYVKKNRPSDPTMYAQWRFSLSGAENDLDAAKNSLPDPTSTPCLKFPVVDGFVVETDKYGVKRSILKGVKKGDTGYRDPAQFTKPQKA